MTSPPALAPLQDGPTLRRVWYDAMTRWQRMPDRLDLPPTRPPVRLDDVEEVMLSDLDPELCAIRGWQ